MQTRKTKRLLIATGIFPPSIGGPATYSKMLEEELPHFGVKPTVISFDAVRKWPKGIRHVLYFLKVWSAAKVCDVIYAQDPVSVGYPSMIAAYLSGVPLYLRVPGDYAWEQACSRFGVTDLLDTFLTKKDYPKQIKRLRKIQKKVANYASCIIVPSEYLKKVVVSWGIGEEKIAVIPNALEGEVPTDTKEILRSSFNIKRQTIFTAGRLVPWKGFVTLVEGLAEYLKANNISLLLAGSGPEKAAIEEAVTRNGLEENVTLMGNLTRRDVLRYLKASDVFALNTAYEGFSHQILEAMALGTPVVTTDVGGNPEVIENNVQGFLVPLDDMEAFKEKITMLLTDQNLHDAIAAKAKARASIFTKNSALLKLLTVLP